MKKNYEEMTYEERKKEEARIKQELFEKYGIVANRIFFSEEERRDFAEDHI